MYNSCCQLLVLLNSGRIASVDGQIWGLKRRQWTRLVRFKHEGNDFWQNSRGWGTACCLFTHFTYLLRLRVIPFLSEPRVTRFRHLWQSLATIFAPLHHVTPMPCRYSPNVWRQVFRGLSLDLFCHPESSSWRHLQAWLLPVSARGQPTSVSAFSSFFRYRDCIPDVHINSLFVIWSCHDTPSIYS